MVALLDEQRGRMGDAELARQAAHLVEIEPTLGRLHEISGRTFDQHDPELVRRALVQRPLALRCTVPIDEGEAVGEIKMGQRIEALALRGNQVPARIADVL
jgi:hypothetical protein